MLKDMSSGYNPTWPPVPAVVVPGQTKSDWAYTGDNAILSLQTDANFPGTTVTFEGRLDTPAAPGLPGDSQTSFPIKSPDGTLYTVTTAPSQIIGNIPAGMFRNIPYVRVVVGSAPSVATTILLGAGPA